MQGWTERLGALGHTVPFDYPYMVAGRKTPDRLPKLLAAHAEALKNARGRSRGPVVLAGKSMGSRVGCHLATTEPVAALVCFGYPLKSPGKSGAVRDAVLLELDTPILFIQGTRDTLCPLDLLEDVRGRMKAPNSLHVVESGNHSLEITKTHTKRSGETQDDVDAAIGEAVSRFLDEHA